MISKELLSEVLGVEVKYLETDIKKINDNINATIQGGSIAYYVVDEWKYINIYELASKCKELALKNDWVIKTSIYGVNKIAEAEIFNGVSFHIFEACTEPEAVFNAITYIMEQLNVKEAKDVARIQIRQKKLQNSGKN